MKHQISSVEELGLVIRAVRKRARIRQDDLAAIVNVSKQFAVDVEKGKPTVQMGRVLKLLDELGIPLVVEIPNDVEPTLQLLQQQRERAKAANKVESPRA